MFLHDNRSLMKNKTIAVIADKTTGVIKSIESEIITSGETALSLLRWECQEAIKKTINKNKYKILSINIYFYD